MSTDFGKGVSPLDINAWAESKGYQIVAGPISIIARIQKEMRDRHETGELSPRVHNYIDGMRYLDGLGFTPKTVIIAALPRTAHMITFCLSAGPREVLLPPTYLGYGDTSRRLLKELRDTGAYANLELLHAPLKAIATGLGLAMYGRNNIAYVPGFGSYHQLVGLVTDAELGSIVREPVEPRVMPSCRDCRACMAACPTGAIGEDRFLLRGERCLTMFNEDSDPWPDWLPSNVHHALVGCMVCQQACPQNANRLKTERCNDMFSESETAELLGGEGELDGPLAAKFGAMGLNGYELIIRRNLKAALAGRD